MAGPVLTSDHGAQFRPPLCWPLLPVPDEAGRLSYPDLETSVRQRIEAILRTAPGEQLMRPEFGAGLEQAINMPNSSSFRGDLQRRISAHIRAYEPRITLDAVQVVQTPDPTVLMVTIAYRIRQIGIATAISVAVPVGGAA